MYSFKDSKHLFKKSAFGMLLIFSCLFIIGCSANGTAKDDGAEAKETVDKNEQAIRTVIEKEFTGPDEKYIELWDVMEEVQVSDEYIEDYEAFLESPEYQDLMNYMKETYASYFTENGYETFKNTAAFMYAGIVHDYELNLSPIEIVQNEQEPTLYNITFQVESTDENGDANQFDFEGKAIVPEEGKIGKIEYLDGFEGGLLEKLRNNQ